MGSFTAGAVIEAVVWSDDFNRTVASGLGPDYTFSYGAGGFDRGSVDGAEAVVPAPNLYTGWNFNSAVLGTLESLTVQFDVWIQAVASTRTYYWFAQQHLGTDMYFIDTGTGELEIEFLDQSTNTWLTYDLLVDPSSWYTYKIRRGGGEQKAKLWKVGDPEPDWQVTGGVGPPYPRTFDTEIEVDATGAEAGKLDNLRIWSLEPQPSSFTASAFIQRTVAGSLTADAEIHVPGAFAARAVKRKTLSATWTADGIRRKTITSTSGSSAPTYQGGGSGVSFSNVSSYAIPTNATVGQEMFVAISYDAQGNAARTFAPTVSGWTLVSDFKDPSADGGLVIWRKTKATGDLATTTFQVSPAGAVNAAYGTMFVAGLFSTPVVVTTGVSGGRTSHVSNDIGWDGTLPSLLLFFAAATISSTWTPPSGMSEAFDTTFTFAGIEGATQTLTPGSSTGGTRTAVSTGNSATILVTVLLQAPAGGFSANAVKTPRFTANAVISGTPHFNADAVIRLPTFTVNAWKFKPGITRTFTAGAVIATVMWDDTFTRNRITGLGSDYTRYEFQTESIQAWVDGTTARLDPSGGRTFDSYSLPYVVPEEGVLTFDFLPSATTGPGVPDLFVQLQAPERQFGGVNGRLHYLGVLGVNLGSAGSRQWQLETWSNSFTFVPTPGVWYRAKLVFTLAGRQAYVWRADQQPPTAPQINESTSITTGVTSYLWLEGNTDYSTETVRMDNLRILRISTYDTRSTFTAAAVVGAPFSTFSAAAVIRNTTAEPPVVSFSLPRFGENTAANASSVLLSLGVTQLATDWTFILIAKRAISGTTVGLFADGAAFWTELATAYNADSNIRYHLIRLTYTAAASWTFFDANFANNEWLITGTTFRPSSTARAISAVIDSAQRTTEAPLGDISMPALSVPSGMVAALAAIEAATVGAFTTPAGTSVDFFTAARAGFGAITGFGLHAASGTVGPFTTTYSTPDASPSRRLGYSVGLRVAGGITASADIFAASARVTGTFTAAAYLGAPGGSSTQQHPRGDAFHVEGTYTPADHVLTTRVYGPFPVGTELQTVLEWAWDQYNNRASSNRIWSGFSTAAVRLKAQAGSLTVDARFIRTVTGSFTADAWKRATVTGSITANAARLRTIAGSLAASGAILRGVAGSWTANAAIGTPAASFSFSANAATLRGQAGSFTANATRLKAQTGSLTGDAVIDAGGGTYFDTTYFDTTYFD